MLWCLLALRAQGVSRLEVPLKQVLPVALTHLHSHSVSSVSVASLLTLACVPDVACCCLQGLIKAELDSCDGGRPVYLMGESFGGLLVMALAIKLEAYIDR